MHGSETFLVVEKQALVQVDLSQSILEVCPRATILRAGSPAEATSHLGGVSRLTGAIVGVGVTTLKESGLDRRIKERGGWIVCLDGDHTDAILAEGWHPLPEPFSADDANRLIRALLDQSVSAPAAD